MRITWKDENDVREVEKRDIVFEHSPFFSEFVTIEKTKIQRDNLVDTIERNQRSVDMLNAKLLAINEALDLN